MAKVAESVVLGDYRDDREPFIPAPLTPQRKTISVFRVSVFPSNKPIIQ